MNRTVSSMLIDYMESSKHLNDQAHKIFQELSSISCSEDITNRKLEMIVELDQLNVRSNYLMFDIINLVESQIKD